MKKGIITMSVLAIIACTITAYCWAAGNKTICSAIPIRTTSKIDLSKC